MQPPRYFIKSVIKIQTQINLRSEKMQVLTLHQLCDVFFSAVLFIPVRHNRVIGVFLTQRKVILINWFVQIVSVADFGQSMRDTNYYIRASKSLN